MLLISCGSQRARTFCPNCLTEKEKAEGWELLFDGKDPNIRWRSINGDKFPKEGWAVKENTLVLLPGREGEDIITCEQFANFELVLDYKLADCANTGTKPTLYLLEVIWPVVSCFRRTRKRFI